MQSMKSVTSMLAALLCVAALPARAATIDVSDNHAGRVAGYEARWATNAREGASVRIVGS